MKWKQTIIITGLANAMLLTILFLSALTNRETIVASSQENQENIDKIATTLPFEKALFEKDEISENRNEIEVAKIEESPIKQFSRNEVTGNTISQSSEIVKKETKKSNNTITYKLPASLEKKIESKNALEKIYVKRGDSIDKIAKRHSVRASDITAINNITGSFLRIGQEILIPKNQILSKKKEISKEVIAKAIDLDEKQYYKVKAGDNPWTIAMKHHIKVNELLRLNNLSKEKARKLRPGNKLRIR
jgi:peptidoglycan DL-endopeptidase LytF